MTRYGIVALVLLCGCATRATNVERVVLLPEQDGSPSAVVVKRPAGERVLAKPYEGFELAGAEERTFTSSAAEVERRYGTLIRTIPARPVAENLYFSVGSTELDDKSRAAAKALASKLTSFTAPQVSVTGHTDSTGNPDANEKLSMERAQAVRDFLVKLGVPADAIEVAWRGAREPVMAADKAQSEQANRRVEIRLR